MDPENKNEERLAAGESVAIKLTHSDEPVRNWSEVNQVKPHSPQQDGNLDALMGVLNSAPGGVYDPSPALKEYAKRWNLPTKGEGKNVILDLSELPTFGGPRPPICHDDAISWDFQRVLVGFNAKDPSFCRIMTRKGYELFYIECSLANKITDLEVALSDIRALHLALRLNNDGKET